jgi:GTP-binding protein Era
MTKTAFIAIVGCPNVGKSSLLNRLLGAEGCNSIRKAADHTHKNNGWYLPRKKPSLFLRILPVSQTEKQARRKMVKAVDESISGVDACMFVVEPEGELRPAETELIERFKKRKCPLSLLSTR